MIFFFFGSPVPINPATDIHLEDTTILVGSMEKMGNQGPTIGGL
jgi:hypothetical protein